MTYQGWDGREYEDAELANMRERPQADDVTVYDAISRAYAAADNNAELAGEDWDPEEWPRVVVRTLAMLGYAVTPEPKP